MSASPPIRTVYAELRRLLGPHISSGELLRFASEAIRFYLASAKKLRHGEWTIPYERQFEGRPFELLPIDAAMRDGGWMVMEYELDQFRLETEIGRIRVYELPAENAFRCFAAEPEVTGAESERIMRDVEWLMESKNRRHGLQDDASDEEDNFF